MLRGWNVVVSDPKLDLTKLGKWWKRTKQEQEPRSHKKF